MGYSQSPGVLVPESPASRLRQGPDVHAPSTPQRRVYYLLDSLNVGRTEVQAVELATRLDPERYDVTLGCLRARGPLLEKLQGTSVSVREFYPGGGFDSACGIFVAAEFSFQPMIEKTDQMYTELLRSRGVE